MRHQEGNCQVIGSELKLTFACPSCHDPCWVEWKNLNKQMRCRKCGRRIVIGRKEIAPLADEDCGRIGFHCPRCKHHGSVPATADLRTIQCIACDLPLHLGPDNRLYSAEELSRIQAAAATPKQASWAAAAFGVLGDSLGRFTTRSPLRWPLAVLVLFAITVTGVAGAQALWSLLGASSPEALAEEFTYTCLEGKPNDPLVYVSDDPVQQVEFKRWRTMHFASIGANVRPEGDSVSVAIEPVQQSANVHVFRVVLESAFMGRRTHTQRWTLDSDRWLFDPVGTLNQSHTSAPGASTR